MELKFTAMTAQVTIESLVHLLKNSDINFDSIKVVVGNTKGGYQSPEIPLEKLVNIALGDMHEIISTDQQLDSLNLKSGEQTFKYGCRDLLPRSLHSSKILRTSQNWVHVKNMLGVGRTVAILICEELGVDPDGTKFVKVGAGVGA
ncbi:hypothetical protein L2Z47_04010 [Acinetobacter baumannii]|uniref:hypothetical protein n=1 Tax=Acinetobacter baumannii TaxID=470 RepID=UPI001C041F33|nr:hypothetical protein [Acinetobacter baumannii]MBU0403832.1 hypothetical protein [Acinetobacter baumannii]UMN02956.1 hypothetical protein L2Z47_04010 [Acinetobacter baumannii]HAV3045198.1 hypothetical protein [Acinetobacter baumannii]